eukprot:7882244-Pyramimonas_sp.AAC.1
MTRPCPPSTRGEWGAKVIGTLAAGRVPPVYRTWPYEPCLEGSRFFRNEFCSSRSPCLSRGVRGGFPN